uniref:Uncharacterized protein n=1 Tax=Timema cristinae TaxID=61476 RepID=A0A7R9H2E7_TIMCR|nr:unnamed protein product [Timema cristinae]
MELSLTTRYLGGSQSPMELSPTTRYLGGSQSPMELSPTTRYLGGNQFPMELSLTTRYLGGNQDIIDLSTKGIDSKASVQLVMTAEEYLLEYDSRRGVEYSRFHGYTYDGVWAVALAIQHVAHRIRHIRHNQTMVDFRYRDPLWEDLFLDALKNTSFEGVTINSSYPGILKVDALFGETTPFRPSGSGESKAMFRKPGDSPVEAVSPTLPTETTGTELIPPSQTGHQLNLNTWGHFWDTT